MSWLRGGDGRRHRVPAAQRPTSTCTCRAGLVPAVRSASRAWPNDHCHEQGRHDAEQAPDDGRVGDQSDDDEDKQGGQRRQQDQADMRIDLARHAIGDAICFSRAKRSLRAMHGGYVAGACSPRAPGQLGWSRRHHAITQSGADRAPVAARTTGRRGRRITSGPGRTPASRAPPARLSSNSSAGPAARMKWRTDMPILRDREQVAASVARSPPSRSYAAPRPSRE